MYAIRTLLDSRCMLSHVLQRTIIYDDFKNGKMKNFNYVAFYIRENFNFAGHCILIIL